MLCQEEAGEKLKLDKSPESQIRNPKPQIGPVLRLPNGTPKGCKELSRWLASETSVTTGEIRNKNPGTPVGVPRSSDRRTRGCAASRLSTPAPRRGTTRFVHTFYDRAYGSVEFETLCAKPQNGKESACCTRCGGGKIAGITNLYGIAVPGFLVASHRTGHVRCSDTFKFLKAGQRWIHQDSPLDGF
jgi:hypothetical protein